MAKLQKLKAKSQAQCVYSYLQFQSMNGKEKFLKAMQIGACRRFWTQRCPCRSGPRCGDPDLLRSRYLGGRWPRVEEAPDPSLIIWKNLGKGKIERCCRNVTIFLAAFGLLTLGFWAIVKIYEVNDDFKS